MTVLTNFEYLFATVLFILGLKLLSSPKTARRGNLLAALGMLIAIIATLSDRRIVSLSHILVGLIGGGAIGALVARRVPMTAMPQIVALFNGFGGGASALVVTAEYLRFVEGTVSLTFEGQTALAFGLLIGPLTFSGSLLAFAKLQGLTRSAPVVYLFQKPSNAVLLAAILAMGVWFVFDLQRWPLLVAVVALSGILGVTSVLPIGAADMPVVISLLNACSGLAAAAAGFALGNDILIVSGALIGAAGIILTQLMCRAMNRSLANVLFAGVGTGDSGTTPTNAERAIVRYTPDDAAFVLGNAQSVIVVPGYGLAAAQAQHALQELVNLLTQRDIAVRYAIHPVAGRMPGHMNVLLAEANTPYDLLLEMDQINNDFLNTDVALVIGANDVVNPAARYKKDSPLYGMPILNADQAHTIVVCKRSLKPGFAGEDNELFYDPKTMMVFGDARAMLTKLVQLLKI